MSNTLLAILITTGIAVFFSLFTGWWRLAFAPFGIRSNQMTCKKLGLKVYAPDQIRRVDTILAHFARGFNLTITSRSTQNVSDACDAMSPLFQSFAEEGVAMGYTLRRLFFYNANHFEKNCVKPKPEFRYLYYVGLGFWSGMRNHAPKKIVSIAEHLDPLHQYLCYDGYGFKLAFFDYPGDPQVLSKLNELPDYARHAAYQGVGRAFYFRFMQRVDEMIAHTTRLGDTAIDAAAGIGLAATFVNTDQLHIAQDLATMMPTQWQPHFHLGMCFALKARSINDVDAFEQYLENVETPVRSAIYASIRECDRVELLIRADDKDEKYRRWRDAVTAWMTKNIKYPLAGIRDVDQVIDNMSVPVADINLHCELDR